MIQLQYRVLLTLLTVYHNVVMFACHDGIPYTVKRKLTRIFKIDGIPAVKTSIKDNLNHWVSGSEINIGVTGNSGVGKSSFINAIRDLTPEDEGAAKVGVVETTTEIKAYHHPVNNNIILWDLPGVGTPTFPRYRYFSKIDEEQFDYFIIISSERFTENDLWLAEEFNERDKAFYFVRSKVGQDIENDKRSHPKSHNKESILTDIRNNCNQNLKYVNARNQRVYLIDNYDTEKYDFKLLSLKLMEDASELKRKALDRALIHFSNTLITDKKADLHGRIRAIALASGLAGAMPIPGLDVAVDLAALLNEAVHYRKEFGLDDDSLRYYANRNSLSKDRFTREVGLKSSLIEYTTSGLLTYFAKIGLTQAASYTTSNIMKYLLPIFGNIASGITSYTATTICLNNLLDMMAEDARKINDYKL
ncbi:interferon-inducible GTPase 5-like [Mercenaria mercenaria]|uniref:interferon-inducible GTPase 5-like n=1 Tax=Mercenaria mercenaria TaxID=6596 RepID=UPI00234F5304|nr:interferon-inducible GTPase 5-like [Mercenaria mercenaria]